MNTFTRRGSTGFRAIFAVLLMPLLGVGAASAFEVGEQVEVMVPDLMEFSEGAVPQSFTCRAITEHAVWLVQNESSVDNNGGFDDTLFVPKVVWGADSLLNLVSPVSFTALTNSFESNVWGTVTSACGVPEDLNGDGKVVVILASIPTKYAVSQTTTPRNDFYYADPDFNEIAGEAMEVFYVNIHPYTNSGATMSSAVQMREWNLANGLVNLCMNSVQADEEMWMMRGIAEVMQYRCFGLTQTVPLTSNSHGLYETLKEFQKAASIELTNVTAGNAKSAYAASRGQQFLWLMYLAQREGDGIISTIAKDGVNSGMLSIALAIDPSADPLTAVQDLVVPLYFDWLVCNLHNDFRSDYAGGIYRYNFLEGTTQDTWAHASMGTPFTLSFSSYPIEGTIAVIQKAMAGPLWASQYCLFEDYDQAWTTYFNGQYSDGSGSASAINSRWEGLVVKCDNEAGEFVSVETMQFDDLYNTAFTLTEPNTYIIVTNNNPGGATGMRYYISNDETVPATETAIHQNTLISQYMTVYTALVDAETDEIEGYDWIGPIFEATLGDSTQNIKMSSFYGGVYTGVFSAWATGNYTLSFTGYDSTGHGVTGLRAVAVGFADTDLTLEISSARLDVPCGGAPTGSMITLAETGVLGIAVESSASIANVRGRMTGIIAGPVSIPDVTGTLSFNSSTSEASVYRYTDQGWIKLDSWMQYGKVSASVTEGGIYALGQGIGVFAPELPAQLVLSGNAPNPFTAQTAISFGLPVSGSVRINVFDMTGRLVNTLVNQELAAANHTIVWDGTDANGVSVGAGVYFCRLEAAGQVLTQKMLKVQ